VKIAGAPISWGVCEVPGWGHAMAPDRVLAEMHALGLEATELGPPGYLPTHAGELRELLHRAGLKLVAGFLAVVLHGRERREQGLRVVDREAATLAAAGAETLVLAAALPGDGYDVRGRLTGGDWTRLAATLAAAEELTAGHGIELAVHPHFGTAIAGGDDLGRLLEVTESALCLDTGHLFLCGTDPAGVARDHASRVVHVHLKDVDAGIAARVRSGRLSYAEAVAAGLYRPLGGGDLDIEGVCSRLEAAGYRGWYVLEQDLALSVEPEPAGGPVVAVRQSLDFLRSLAIGRQPTNASSET